MMFQQLTYGTNYTAVEHSLDGQHILLQLQQKKKELIIVKSETYRSLDKITGELEGQKHLFLILNDEQVLSKHIDFYHEDEKRIVKNAFPNINTRDFYYDTYYNGNSSFVVIARKETVNGIINNYLKAGICVIDFSLGNLVIQNLQNFQDYKYLSTSNAKVEFEEHEISSIQKVTLKESYTINDLEVENTQVLSLAGIIGYYSKKASSTIQKELNEKYLHKRFFDVGLKVGLGFLLIILLINFFVFSHFRNEVGNLTGELQMSANFKNQLNSLKKEVDQKKQLVESVHSASNRSFSAYFDELGSSLPESNLLSLINYQPKEGLQKKDKALFFRKNSIVVKGISKNDSDFSNWITVLEKKKWVAEVSILNYGKGKKTEGFSDFEFIITIND